MGQISEEECYADVALEMGLSAVDVRRAFQSARESLTSRPCMVDLIRELKPGRKVYAMSNISMEASAFLLFYNRLLIFFAPGFCILTDEELRSRPF